ncbi:MAG: PIN domain-containing protein [Candidatus Cybelea sp.]
MANLSDLEHYAKVRDGWLIDTNIISATIGKNPLHSGIAHFFESVPDERLYLSVLTIGELRKGVEGSSKRDLLARKLDELANLWADRILPISLDVANKWGELAARYQSGGSAVPAIDGLIAATAYVHNLVVVSHDAFFARMREHIIVYDPLSA